LTVRIATFAGAVALIVCVVGLHAGDRPKSRTHTVTIEGMRFQPERLTVARGDTVVWINKDLVAHTATSGTGRFDSEIIQAEQSWTFTATRKGEYTYICTLHPAMKAMLLVR
jgi:plastocyanin